MGPRLEPSDFAEALAAARSGDRTGWERLYRSFAPQILGYLRNQRAPAAEDLLGEVWLQVVRDIERFKGSAAGFRAWLMRIAHNRMLDAHRASMRRPPETDGEPPAIAIEDESFEQVEAGGGSQLERLLTDLPDQQRQVLYLRYVLDLKFRDIADILGISVAAAKMAGGRGLRSAARHLEEDGNDG